MDTPAKVGEIFAAASKALNNFGDLTLHLHPNTDPSTIEGKWTQKELKMLQQALNSFNKELDKIVEKIDRSKSTPLIESNQPLPSLPSENYLKPQEVEEDNIQYASII